MQKEQKTDLIRIVLYSLSSLLVGAAVGGTLLMRVMQQPPADAVNQAAAALADTTEPGTDVTEDGTAVTTTDLTTTETTTTTTTTAPPDSASIRALLSPASELLTASYFYTDSDTFETYGEMFGARVPFTTDSVVLTYDGEICISVPPDGIRYSVDVREKQIFVTLPQPVLISHTLDESSVRRYDVSDSLFGSSTLSEYLEQLRRRKDAVCRKIRAQRELDRLTLAQADKVIRSLLAAAAETRDYTVIVSYPSE